MKRLTIIRHAKSSWKDPLLEDFHRPLNRRGKQDAPRMGRLLREAGSSPDAILSSPARRAEATALAVAEEVGYSEKEIRWEEDVYGAEPRDLLRILRGLEDRLSHVYLVGHNPGLLDLINLLATVEIPALPTCGIAELEVDVERWAELDSGCGSLVRCLLPREAP